MTLEDQIKNEYFDWMYNLVCRDRYSNPISYKKLLAFLHNTEFIYIISRDENRATDGIDLRYRFAYDHPSINDAESYLDGPCSVLEMMIALSIRCEETIMDNPNVGDRTKQWFWGMVTSLGLGSMTDDRFNRRYAENVIDRFLHREYEPNGKGGLFTIRHRNCDLRDVEIWYQLCWYLDEIV